MSKGKISITIVNTKIIMIITIIIIIIIIAGKKTPPFLDHISNKHKTCTTRIDIVSLCQNDQNPTTVERNLIGLPSVGLAKY